MSTETEGGGVARPAQTDPVLASFFAETTIPSQAQIDFLTQRHGVPNMTLAYDGDRCGMPIGAATVTYRRKRFDFARESDGEPRQALVIVARNFSGWPTDLVAWWPREDVAASYYGRLAILGEQDLSAPRADRPLSVHRGVLGWLKAGRMGIVILDPRQAWRTLEGVKLAAEDIEHGLTLRSALTPPAPSIVVPKAAIGGAQVSA